MVYAEAPWTFKGRALYQLQLVKADEARKRIPSELKLVEFFGYTLGGVYLARYDDSPAGTFDECVAMAGLVWNPPTSCAWAARVYVNSREARDHGNKSVGLPSRLASFDTLSHSSNSKKAWWSKDQIPANAAANTTTTTTTSTGLANQDVVALVNVDRGRRGLPGRPVAVFKLPAIPVTGSLGPRMRLSLPSFSGGTAECPDLLQYNCDLQTSVMPVAPMQIELPRQHKNSSSSSSSSSSFKQQQHPEVLDLLLDGKPLVCLAFSDMLMRVEKPTPLQLAAPAAAAAVDLRPHLLPAFAAVSTLK